MEVAALADCVEFLLRVSDFYISMYLTSFCNYIVLSFFFYLLLFSFSFGWP